MSSRLATWPRRLFTHAVWRLGQHYLEAFKARAAHSDAAQRRNLAGILKRSAGSAFFRDMGLQGVESAERFRQLLPIAGYAAFEPYIHRAMQGETSALFRPQSLILMYAMTSGTTGRPKYIPVTKASWDEYQLSWLVWGLAAAESHPELPFRPFLTLASSWRTETAPSGVRCGAISGFLATRVQGQLRTTRHACPPEVALIEDTSLRQLATLRCALAQRDLLMITTANPSTLLTFARALDLRKEELCRLLVDGGASLAKNLGKAAGGKLEVELKRKDPQLAKHLEFLIARAGRLLPSDAWPSLSLLGVWTEGSLQPYLGMLPQYYGQAVLRDHGLSASEGHITIPIDEGREGGVLNINEGFYEFIPEDESSNPAPRAQLPHELEIGQRYFVVLTTSGGLFRYDIRDLVQCTGFFGTTPILRFLNKGSDIASITGEKLTAHQVAQAAIDVGRSLHATLFEFVVAPVWGDPPHYVLLAEPDQLRSFEPKALESAFDDALMNANIEYRSKRESHRLAPLQVVTAKVGAWRALREARLAAGATPEQYKHPFLVTDLGFAAAQREAS